MPILFKRRRAKVQPRAATGFKKFNPGCPTRNCCSAAVITYVPCGNPATTMPKANINLSLTFFRGAAPVFNPAYDPGPIVSGPVTGICDRTGCHDPAVTCSYCDVTWTNPQNTLNTTLIFDGTGHWQSPEIVYFTQRRDYYGCADDGSGDLAPFCASVFQYSRYWEGSGYLEVWCPGNGPAQLRGNFGLRFSPDGANWCVPQANAVGNCPAYTEYYDAFAQHAQGGFNPFHSCGYHDNTEACGPTEGMPSICFDHAFTYNANITNPTLTPWSWTDGNAVMSV